MHLYVIHDLFVFCLFFCQYKLLDTDFQTNIWVRFLIYSKAGAPLKCPSDGKTRVVNLRLEDVKAV